MHSQYKNPLHWLFVLTILSFFTLNCSGDVQVTAQGCENCIDRCLSDDGIRGRCVTCIKDEQCRNESSPTRKCDKQNRCVCGTDKDCPEGTHCGGNKGCVECLRDSQCTSQDRPVCGLDNSCLPCKPNQVEACMPVVGQFCEEGTRTCQSNNQWGPCEGAKACKAGQKCDDKKCVNACKNDCKQGELKCTTSAGVVPGKYQSCVRDSQGCLGWSTAQSNCRSTYVCSNDQCIPYKCPPAPCQLNKTRCFDSNHYQKCVRNSKGCPTWSTKIKCSSSWKCNNDLNRCVLCSPGKKVACYTGPSKTRNIGNCKDGTKTCNATGTKYESCQSQVLPKKEECNGLDDDCDGKTDPGCECINGKSRSCYSGQSGCKALSNGNFQCTGVCKVGTQTCKAGKWSACSGEVLPSTKDTCGDGKDDNCDGTPDDGCQCKPKETQPCGSDVGICKKGTQTCDSLGQWGPCVGGTKPKSKEECNGLDDDCDGKTDPGCNCINGKTRSCYSGKSGCKALSNGNFQCTGVCKVGTQTCQAGQWNACSGEVLPTSRDQCGDGKDDNCDGTPDDGCQCKPKETRPCGTDAGICKKGTQTCDSLGQWGACIGGTGPKNKEECNGLDDDCNGKIDDGIPNLNAPCKAGTGECQRTGKNICNSTQDGVVCDAKPGPKGVEVCDGKDNNCNGQVDEQTSRSCYTGTPSTSAGVGACRKGKERCTNGKFTGICENQVTPSTEVCSNQKDDDCDGAVDEQSGRALQFSGSYDRVEFPHNAAYNFSESKSFSLEMWFNFDKLGTRKIALLLNKHQTNTNFGFHLKIQVDASKTAPQCAISWWDGNNGNQILFGDCLAAQWTHIALVFDKPNNRIRFYKDGQVIYNQPAPSNFKIRYSSQGNNPLVLGSETGVSQAGDPSLRGKIAAVRLSNSVRYSQTNQQRFTPDCTFASDANTVGLWNLEDGGGSSVKDLSSLGNNGKITGPKWIIGRTCNAAKFGGCKP